MTKNEKRVKKAISSRLEVFLKEKRVYTLFVKNVVKYWTRPQEDGYIPEHIDRIDEAFLWSATEQGCLFWGGLNEELKNFSVLTKQEKTKVCIK